MMILMNGRPGRCVFCGRCEVVIDNYPENQVEEFECANHPQNPDMGIRQVPFSRVLYIERDDFMENPPKKYHRLGPGREVRLRNAYVIKFESMVKDDKNRRSG